MCDEIEEEDFLVKNINLFKVKLAMRKMAKENTLNDGHKVKVTDLIEEKESENDLGRRKKQKSLGQKIGEKSGREIR